MAKSRKPRKRHDRFKRARSMLSTVKMEHDTSWDKGGQQYAMVSVRTPVGWTYLDGSRDRDAALLDEIKRRTLNWYVKSWVRCLAPDGQSYIEETEFAANDVKLDDLESLAKRAKEENMAAINPAHYVCSGWTAKTYRKDAPFQPET